MRDNEGDRAEEDWVGRRGQEGAGGGRRRQEAAGGPGPCRRPRLERSGDTEGELAVELRGEPARSPRSPGREQGQADPARAQKAG